MKRLFIAIILAMVLAETGNVYATEKEYTIDIPYQYPIKPGMEEWEEFQSLKEMIDACEIPRETIDAMTTKVLIETVLNYPLIINTQAYDTPKIGIEKVEDYFYGLRALLFREDVRSALEDIIESGKYNGEDSMSIVQRICLESLYSYIIYNEEYAGLENEILSTGATLYTPNGTAVNARYNTSWSDLGTTQSDALAQEAIYISSYPGAQEIRTVSPKYNCHSYSFVSTVSTNKYWLNGNQAIKYINDGSYTEVTASQTKLYGDIVWYGQSHSGKVVSVSNTGTVRVRSKWGSCGLFQHSVAYCPWSTENGVTYYR